MSVSEKAKDGVVCLSVSDEMTIYTAAELKNSLFSCWDKAIELEVDLSQVTEMDSAGMQILMQLKHEGELCQKPVRFIHHSPPVLQVIGLLNLTSKFGDPVVLSADMEMR